MSVMLLILAFMCSLVGCAYLAISQDRNFRLVQDDANRRAPSRKLRPLGFVLLFLALCGCLLRDGVSFAALLWPLMLGISAVVVAQILSFRPAFLKPLLAIDKLALHRAKNPSSGIEKSGR